MMGFLLFTAVHTGSEFHPSSYPMGAGRLLLAG